MKNIKVKLILSVLVLMSCDPNGPFTAFSYLPPDGHDAEDNSTNLDAGIVDANAGNVNVDANTVSEASIDGSSSTGGMPGAGGAGAGGGGVLGTGGASDTGGTLGTGVVDACVSTTHTNGVGQHWQDCVPYGTYNARQALRACNAYIAVAGGYCSITTGCGSAPHIVQAVNDSNDYLWGYDGNTAGYVGMGGACPNPTNGKIWN